MHILYMFHIYFFISELNTAAFVEESIRTQHGPFLQEDALKEQDWTFNLIKEAVVYTKNCIQLRTKYDQSVSEDTENNEKILQTNVISELDENIFVTTNTSRVKQRKKRRR